MSIHNKKITERRILDFNSLVHEIIQKMQDKNSEIKNFISNSKVLFIGKASTQFISFLLLPIYTSYFTRRELGQLDIYLSLSMIILSLMTLQIENGVFRFLLKSLNDLKEQKKTITNGIFILFLLVFLFSGVYLIAFLFIRFESASLLWFYYISLGMYSLVQQIQRGFLMNKSYAFVSFMNSTTILTLNILLIVILKFNIEGVIISNIISNIIFTILVLILVRIDKYFSKALITKKDMVALLVFSIPLVFNQLSSYIINYSDRLIILYYFGLESNGIYSVANKFFLIPLIFFSIFNMSWTEVIVKTVDSNKNLSTINNIFIALTNIYIVLVIIILLGSPIVFNFLVDINFYETYFYIPILLVAAFFSGISANIGSVFIALNKTKEVGLTTFLAGFINIICHFLLIKFIGLYAASISTLISFVVLAIYRAFGIRKFLVLKFTDYKTFFLFGSLAFSVFVYYTKNYFYITASIFIIIIIVFIYFILNHSKIRELISYFWKN